MGQKIGDFWTILTSRNLWPSKNKEKIEEK